MSRSFLAFAALAFVPAVSLAHHVDAQISISTASAVHVSVKNQSGSPNANERELMMISVPEITVSGQAFCTNGAGIHSVQLHFGLDHITSGPNGHTPTFTYDSSEPVYYEQGTGAAFSIKHALALSPTWEFGAIDLKPNAVHVVEKQLQQYVAGGGSAIDFLRTDDVFETTFIAFATVGCKKNGNVYYQTTSKLATFHVLYQGDPNISVQTVGEAANQVASNQPALPPEAIYAAKLGPRKRHDDPRGGDVGSGDSRDPDGGDSRDPTDPGDRYASHESFDIYDVEDGYFTEVWSGYVTYLDDGEDVCSEAQMAVTADGHCVLVEGCMPAEFSSCRALEGCCL